MAIIFDYLMSQFVRPTISIALCTYNGADHLHEQWQSLIEQRRLPDEVVICDDQSTDNTVALVRQLAANAPFAVRILQNPVRLGYNHNFEQAIRQCRGELIFLCDQDDFWLPEKISTMSDFMVAHPDTRLGFCDAWVTDDELTGRHQRFWERVNFDAPTRQRWQSGEMMDVMLDGNRIMGCAMVLRRSFLASVLPIPANVPGYIYDGWIGLVAAACEVAAFVDQPLQLYRTHEQQQVGVRDVEQGERIRLRERFARHRIKKLEPLRERQAQLAVISRLLAERVSPDAPGLPQLHRRLSHFTMRSCLPPERFRRLRPVLRGLAQGNYNRYAAAAANWYAPYLAALGDIFE